MKKIKVALKSVQSWYKGLTQGEADFPSLSDTQFFWITTVWLILLPFVTYCIFYLGKASWIEFLVYTALEICVLAFKYAKYIKVSHNGSSAELVSKEEKGERSSGKDQSIR